MVQIFDSKLQAHRFVAFLVAHFDPEKKSTRSASDCKAEVPASGSFHDNDLIRT
jgi:hypothetical protein